MSAGIKFQFSFLKEDAIDECNDDSSLMQQSHETDLTDAGLVPVGHCRMALNCLAHVYAIWLNLGQRLSS
jgi:hypothetical protein